MSLLQLPPQTQLVLALSIFVATFIYEDGATLLAATLSAAGRLNPAVGLMAAFAGIWLGDIGLYAIGSTFRQCTLKWHGFHRFLEPESLEKSQAWFAKHGSLALVISRTIPGSRLPLYLAAGALRLPLRRFVRITGMCAAIWVSMIFAIWRYTPSEWTGAGNFLRWGLTAGLLIVPWTLGKSLSLFSPRAGITERPESQRSLTACAL